MTALVIYHANCYDGFTAAWIAKQVMPDCQLFEGRHGDEAPFIEATGRDVFILDFSYHRDAMLMLRDAAKSLVVLDHHKTARADCHGLEFCTFDMTRSGAGMAWDYFMNGTKRPAWIDCVEDRDLWRFKYSGTKYLHAYMASVKMNLNEWGEIADTDFPDIVQAGVPVLRYIRVSIDKALEQSRVVELEGCTVAVLNVPYQNASETADAMLRKYPDADYSMSYFQRADSRWQYSLRSRSNFDVSAIATRYGGGGHAQAAGFDTDEAIV